MTNIDRIEWFNQGNVSPIQISHIHPGACTPCPGYLDQGEELQNQANWIKLDTTG